MVDEVTDDFQKAVWSAVVHNLTTELAHIKASTEEIRRSGRGFQMVEQECEKLSTSITFAELAINRLFTNLGFTPFKARKIPLFRLLRRTEDLVKSRLPTNIYLDIPRAELHSGGELVLLADEFQLVDVLAGLINNSSRALQATGGTIKIEFIESSDQIKISVIDDGPGIPNNLQNKIFLEPVPSQRGGRGVGLFIYSKIVRGFGGRIIHDNSVKGTKMTVEIPKQRKSSLENSG